jgi:hypothetical protein
MDELCRSPRPAYAETTGIRAQLTGVHGGPVDETASVVNGVGISARGPPTGDQPKLARSRSDIDFVAPTAREPALAEEDGGRRANARPGMVWPEDRHPHRAVLSAEDQLCCRATVHRRSSSALRAPK